MRSFTLKTLFLFIILSVINCGSGGSSGDADTDVDTDSDADSDSDTDCDIDQFDLTGYWESDSEIYPVLIWQGPTHSNGDEVLPDQFNLRIYSTFFGYYEANLDTGCTDLILESQEYYIFPENASQEKYFKNTIFLTVNSSNSLNANMIIQKCGCNESGNCPHDCKDRSDWDFVEERSFSATKSSGEDSINDPMCVFSGCVNGEWNYPAESSKVKLDYPGKKANKGWSKEFALTVEKTLGVPSIDVPIYYPEWSSLQGYGTRKTYEDDRPLMIAGRYWPGQSYEIFVADDYFETTIDFKFSSISGKHYIYDLQLNLVTEENFSFSRTVVP